MTVKKYKTHLGNKGNIFPNVREALETILGRQFYVNSSPKQDHSETAFGKHCKKQTEKSSVRAAAF